MEAGLGVAPTLGVAEVGWASWWSTELVGVGRGAKGCDRAPRRKAEVPARAQARLKSILKKTFQLCLAQERKIRSRTHA